MLGSRRRGGLNRSTVRPFRRALARARLALAEAARRRHVWLGQRDRRRREHLEELRGRILRLALLAPDIVEGILTGEMDRTLILERLERPLPASWDEQLALLGL